MNQAEDWVDAYHALDWIIVHQQWPKGRAEEWLCAATRVGGEVRVRPRQEKPVYVRNVKINRNGFDVNMSDVRHAFGIDASAKGIPTVSEPRRAGRKPTQKQAVAAYIAKRFPDGLPADVKQDTLVADYTKETGAHISLRTLRRALGGN